MNISVDDKQISYVLDGLESLMEHWREFDYDVSDVLIMAMMHKAIKDYVNKRIDDIDRGPETLTREPNKGERFVLGRQDYVKT